MPDQAEGDQTRFAPRRSASPSDPRPRPRPRPRKLSPHPLALSPSSWASRRRVTCLSFPSRCYPESLDRKACSNLGAHRLSTFPASSSPPDFITSDKQARKASLNNHTRTLENVHGGILSRACVRRGCASFARRSLHSAGQGFASPTLHIQQLL
jgi:hypothetical protein